MRKRPLNTLIAVGICSAIVLLLFAGYVEFPEIAGSPGHHQQQRDTRARGSGDVGGSTSLQPKSPGNDQTAHSTDSDSGATLTGWIQAPSAPLIAFLTLAILAAYRHQTQIMTFALAETQKAADSTSRTVRIMESVAQHQLRAYIGVEKIGFTSKSSQKPRFISSGITIEDLINITIKNYGSTSAYDVRTRVNLVATTAGDELPDDFLYKGIKSSISDQDSYTEPVIIEPDCSHIVRCPDNSEFRKKSMRLT